MPSPSAPRPAPPPARGIVLIAVLVPVIAALALWAFAWPAARLAPRDLPVGVAGPAAATAPLERSLAARGGAFEVHRYAGEAAAREAIENREVYGAVVVSAGGPELLTASAASPAVAQLLREAVAGQAPPGTEVRVTDVVAAPPSDPRGAALGASLLPLSLAGVATGVLVWRFGLRGPYAPAALLAAAALAGAVAAALGHGWLGVLTGDWWAEAGTLALAVLAVGSAVAGLAALLGPAGIGLGALTVVLLGNPFSGAASAPELLPEPAGALGQWLPPGAAGTALRSVAYFDGHGAAGPVLVLALWSAFGLAALALGRRRGAPGPDGTARARSPLPAA
ncbi:hypothetical protein GCM10010420_16750 [Streptomyces glaucosporus]|uniref:Integral membrane protein n=1 Tax=Streptomyces glaucosporus TaxID=284044 RepID=A0ABP5V208_9ACTN